MKHVCMHVQDPLWRHTSQHCDFACRSPLDAQEAPLQRVRGLQHGRAHPLVVALEELRPLGLLLARLAVLVLLHVRARVALVAPLLVETVGLEAPHALVLALRGLVVHQVEVVLLQQCRARSSRVCCWPGPAPPEDTGR